MQFTKNNQQVIPAFLALGFCPCQRSGGYYDTAVIPVFLSRSQLYLLKADWFSACAEFPQAEAWFSEQEEFYFPSGKDASRQWTETQWQLFTSFEAAEKKAQMWGDNDLSEEMPEFEFMHTQQAKRLAYAMIQVKESGKCC